MCKCHHLKYCGGGCRVTAEFPFCWHENDHEHEVETIKAEETEIIE